MGINAVSSVNYAARNDAKQGLTQKEKQALMLDWTGGIMTRVSNPELYNKLSPIEKMELIYPGGGLLVGMQADKRIKDTEMRFGPAGYGPKHSETKKESTSGLTKALLGIPVIGLTFGLGYTLIKHIK